MSANTSSVGVTPTLASIINKHASAISTARSVKRRMRPCRLSSVTSSRPAVSIIVNLRCPSRAAPSRRSLVTPGWLSTKASFRPTRRLNKVDLPTFGRPTIASVKDIQTYFQEIRIDPYIKFTSTESQESTIQG